MQILFVLIFTRVNILLFAGLYYIITHINIELLFHTVHNNTPVLFTPPLVSLPYTHTLLINPLTLSSLRPSSVCLASNQMSPEISSPHPPRPSSIGNLKHGQGTRGTIVVPSRRPTNKFLSCTVLLSTTR